MHRWQYCINDFSLRLPCTRPDILRHHHLSSQRMGTLFHIISFSIHLHIGSTVRLPFGVRITRIITYSLHFADHHNCCIANNTANFGETATHTAIGIKIKCCVFILYPYLIDDDVLRLSNCILLSLATLCRFSLFLIFPPQCIFHSMMTNLSADPCKRGYV